mmetsp:Transcript_46555/g.105196  ORF Transcript_46555/g.105196 Transcript_46555/m.105196 type:complete len:238 (-) Transcript_46555:85-798(-)
MFLGVSFMRRLAHARGGGCVCARGVLCVYGGGVLQVLENIGYALMGGVATAVVRSFLTVPLHASTGVQIGANLVPFRFKTPPSLPLAAAAAADTAGADADGSSAAPFSSSPAPLLLRQSSQLPEPGPCCSPAWWREQLGSLVASLWGPVLLHGSYDVLLFVAGGECGAWQWLTLGAYAGVVGQACYIRWRVFSMERRYPPDPSHDVHAKIKSGEIPRPCICCACLFCTCCRCCECCY